MGMEIQTVVYLLILKIQGNLFLWMEWDLRLPNPDLFRWYRIRININNKLLLFHQQHPHLLMI